jgi:hypothetical protein
MSRELRIQAGAESTWGTSVTPTVVLRGLEEFRIQLAPDVRMLDDMSIALAGSSEAVLASNTATASASGWASYEHICYFLDSLLGEATPSGGGPYTYAYAAPTTTAPTVRMMTLVNSDGTVGGYNITSAVANSMTLTGEAGEPLMFSAEFIGWRSEADALEALTAPDVTPVMMDQVGSITWDTWAGTMGATSLDSCYVRSFELTMTANRTPRFCIGSQTPSTYYENAWESTLNISLEFNATTKTDVTAIATSNLRQKQVELNWATSGNETLQLQFAGTVSNQPELFTDADGVATVDLELTRTYQSTFANWFKASVDHDNATLT